MIPKNPVKPSKQIHEVQLVFKDELVIDGFRLILKSISSLNKKLDKIMLKQEQINASLTQLNDATNTIAAKIQKLIDSNTAGDPVSQESLDQLQLVADQLKAMGADPVDPIPTV